MTPRALRTQQGAALIIMLALIGILAVALILRVSNAAANRTQRDLITSAALARAVEVLIARAADDATRPGSLPCPDVNNDGESTIAADWTGSTCTSYIGRLPWKYLGLPDLRDGDGERLWYALSPGFRDNAAAGTLNSTTPGSLQVTGVTSLTNVIAIVFAAGGPTGTQVRASANETDITQYLEGENANGDATYSNAAASAGFNDQMLAITSQVMMPAVQKRVAREAKRCVELAASGGKYPFAAPMSDTTSFNDAAGQLFGRIPRTLTATNTALTAAGLAAAAWPNMTWPSRFGHATPTTTVSCMALGTWWDDWRELLLYQVAAAYAPDATGPMSCPADCLYVNNVGSGKVVVAVAGPALANPNQSGRSSDKTNPANYLETDPATTINNASAPASKAFSRGMPSGSPPGFNDSVDCIHQLSNTWPCRF